MTKKPKKHPKEEKRCEAQLELDPDQFSSCQYEVAYPKLNVRWLDRNNLHEPGHDKLRDRKVAFYKTHPEAYKGYKAQVKAGIYYVSPINWVWDSVNGRECNVAYDPRGYGSGPAFWNCQIGNGYYGGTQSDEIFENTYNPTAKSIWGHASNWPIAVQKYSDDKAYVNRGLRPWPSSYAALGKYPASKSAVIKALKDYLNKRPPFAYVK